MATQSTQVQGKDLAERVKELVHEGNVRRVVIKQEDGDTVAEFPLTVGVVGALVAPMLAAVGALGALLARGTIEVEREATPEAERTEPASPRA